MQDGLLSLFAIQISTHAPHAGSDVNRFFEALGFQKISTHAPHAGSDY